MKIVLKKLAQFHASSAIYCENSKPLDEKFSRGVYNHGMTDIFDQHYDFNFTFIIDNIFSTWPQLSESIIAKMVCVMKEGILLSAFFTNLKFIMKLTNFYI
jgi:hypothetical protein